MNFTYLGCAAVRFIIGHSAKCDGLSANSRLLSDLCQNDEQQHCKDV